MSVKLDMSKIGQQKVLFIRLYLTWLKVHHRKNRTKTRHLNIPLLICEIKALFWTLRKIIFSLSDIFLCLKVFVHSIRFHAEFKTKTWIDFSFRKKLNRKVLVVLWNKNSTWQWDLHHLKGNIKLLSEVWCRQTWSDGENEWVKVLDPNMMYSWNIIRDMVQ